MPQFFNKIYAIYMQQIRNQFLVCAFRIRIDLVLLFTKMIWLCWLSFCLFLWLFIYLLKNYHCYCIFVIQFFVR